MIALVTGANRGIGLEVCRQLARSDLRVLLTARDEERGRRAAAGLRAEGLTVEAHQLDVTDPDSVRRLMARLETDAGAVDILVNNAGVALDKEVPGLTVDLERIRKIMEVNAYGALRMCQAVIPTMVRRRYGRIVNVSSRLGALHAMAGGWLGYRLSKASLNVITRVLADEVRGTGVLINAVAPGHVRTEMGGPNAPRSVEQGADTAVFLALLPDDGPTGGFFYDRKPLDW